MKSERLEGLNIWRLAQEDLKSEWRSRNVLNSRYIHRD